MAPFSRFAQRLRDQERAGGRVVPRWAPALLATCAIALVPWTVLLVAELPDRKTARHWDIAWGGLDVAIAAALIGLVAAILRRSVWTPVAAVATATLLGVDAWFDIVTADGAGERWTAVGMAALSEIPLAVLCLLIARNVERVLEQARRYATAAGFRPPRPRP